MSLITKNNYEAYLLDYLEENLSPELVAELMLFLENNPELKEELEGVEDIKLIPKDEFYENKTLLKAFSEKVNLLNYEALLIAKIEEVIPREEEEKLAAFLAQNPVKEKELAVYQKTKLIAPNIVFKDKNSLKKKERKVIPIYWWYTSAAALILALFLLKGINWNSESTTPKIANATKNKVEKNLEGQGANQNTAVVVAEEKHQLKKIKKEKVENKQKTTFENKQEYKIQLAEIASEKKEIVEDTSSTKKQEEALLIEEDLYANVKIVYEEESPSKKIPQAKTKKKRTKLDIASTIVQEEVKGTLKKGKEKILLAFNSKPLNFLRKKKKN